MSGSDLVEVVDAQMSLQTWRCSNSRDIYTLLNGIAPVSSRGSIVAVFSDLLPARPASTDLHPLCRRAGRACDLFPLCPAAGARFVGPRSARM